MIIAWEDYKAAKSKDSNYFKARLDIIEMVTGEIGCLINYINKTGWTKINNKDIEIAVFQKTNSNSELKQIVVPLNKTFADYADAMIRVANTLIQDINS